MASQGDHQIVLFTTIPPRPLGSRDVIYYNKKTVQDYVNFLENNSILDTYCIKCEKVIDEADGYMKCCPDEEYVEKWMKFEGVYKSLTFHKFCRQCFSENVKPLIENPLFCSSRGMRCFVRNCRHDFSYADLHRWTYEIENPLLHFVVQNNWKVLGRNIFECKRCKCKAIIPVDLKFYICKKCQYYVCVDCQRSATQAHECLTCEQMALAEEIDNVCFAAQNSLRLSPPPRKMLEP